MTQPSEGSGGMDVDVRDMAIVLRESKITFGGVEQTKLGSKAADTLTAQAAEIASLTADKQALIKQGIATLDLWRLAGEGQGILEGWLRYDGDPDHLESLRKGTREHLERVKAIT